MKLIVQIPCYNEEAHIVKAIEAIPRNIPGISELSILVINDCSTDQTLRRIENIPNIEILNLKEHVGLAQVFYEGIKKALEMGADIVVNYDADMQYCSEEILPLIQPILAGEAVVVIGERPYFRIKHFKLLKKVLLFFGAQFISLITGYGIKDPASGFRAYHKSILQDLEIFSSYTYTLESILFFSKKNIPIHTMALKKCSSTRPSRLIKTNMHYIILSIITVFSTLWRNRSYNDRKTKEK